MNNIFPTAMKTLYKLFLSFTAALMLFSCTGNTGVEEPITSFTILQPVVQLKIGEMQILMLSVNRNATWTTSDETVATIVEGVVEAKQIGHAVITATIGNVSATADVYVTGSNGSTFIVKPYALEMDKHEQQQLTCRDTYGLPLTWSSDNEEIAVVSADGLVTAVGPGVTEIHVTNGMESESVTAFVRHKWGEYKMVWSDEFNAAELDRNTWNVEVTDWPQNNEAQAYRDHTDYIRVENGNLVIELRKVHNAQKDYTSGRMNSRGKKMFKYGRMESRIKFPKGKGTWPAFWMMGTKGSWPYCGECDIVEHMGKMPNFTSFAVHTQKANGTGAHWHSGWTAPYSMEDDYHVYGIEWTEEETFGCDVIRFTVDGEVYATTTENSAHRDDRMYWPFNQEMYFIFNLAYGGNLGGQTDDSIFENGNRVQMLVDWVRVYQRDEIE